MPSWCGLAKERHGGQLSEAAEHRALRIIAGTFFVVVAGVAVESVRELATGKRPSASGARRRAHRGVADRDAAAGPAKRNVGRQLGSRAMQADAAETVLCVWLSAIVLAGLLLNVTFGWWWPDPVAALGIVYVAAREGREAWNGDVCGWTLAVGHRAMWAATTAEARRAGWWSTWGSTCSSRRGWPAVSCWAQ